MDKITINVPDGHEIDLTKSNLSKGEIYFKKLESKYPLSVREIKNREWYVCGDGVQEDLFEDDLENVSTESRAKAFLALMQLVELRDAWNKIDGFVADWNDNSQGKHCVLVSSSKICIDRFLMSKRVLYFNSEKTADLFINTFKDLIEEAKELL